MDIIAKYTEVEDDTDFCVNCLEEIHTPDDRTGTIHKHGKYACFTYTDQGKPIRLSTVAEGK